MCARLRLESQMLYPIEQWLLNRNYLTKVEIQLPWGICDLVGVKPNLARVADRVETSGRRTIGDFANAWVLQHLPAESSRRAVTETELADKASMVLTAGDLAQSLADLVTRGLAARTSAGKYQRAGTWFPYHDDIVAVELKLSRIEDVVSQAVRHKGLTRNSYIALPISLAEKLLGSNRKNVLQEAGVGLLATDGDKCRELIAPRDGRFKPEPVFAALIADRFWTELLKTVHH